jgi:hypothetical protein
MELPLAIANAPFPLLLRGSRATPAEATTIGKRRPRLLLATRLRTTIVVCVCARPLERLHTVQPSEPSLTDIMLPQRARCA